MPKNKKTKNLNSNNNCLLCLIRCQETFSIKWVWSHKCLPYYTRTDMYVTHNFATRREDFGTMLAYLVFIRSHILRNSSGVTYYYVPWRSMSSFFWGTSSCHATFVGLNWHLNVACHVNLSHILTKAFICVWQATSFKEFKQ
jgi:hypothetical protein